MQTLRLYPQDRHAAANGPEQVVGEDLERYLVSAEAYPLRVLRLDHPGRPGTFLKIGGIHEEYMVGFETLYLAGDVLGGGIADEGLKLFPGEA